MQARCRGRVKPKKECPASTGSSFAPAGIIVLIERVVFSQLQIGPRDVVDVSLHTAGLVLLDDVRAEGGVHLGVAWGDVEHGGLRIADVKWHRRSSIAVTRITKRLID